MPGIRTLRPADHSGLASLMEEMQRHYRVPCPPRETILSDLAALPAGIEIWIAEGEGGAILGFASLCNLYPGPGLRTGLFLKEIYVAADGRGQGTGRALMRAIAQDASRRGLGRIDWTADADDAALLRFYDRLGASVYPKKLFHRLGGDALAAAGQGDP